MLGCVAGTFQNPKVGEINKRLSAVGRSPRWLAQQLGLPYRSVLNWLNGDTTPRNEEAFDSMLLRIQDEYSTISDIDVDKRALGVRIKSTSIIVSSMRKSPGDERRVIRTTDVIHTKLPAATTGFEVSSRELAPHLLIQDEVGVTSSISPEPGHVVLISNGSIDHFRVLRMTGGKRTFHAISDSFEPISGPEWIVEGVVVSRSRLNGPGHWSTDTWLAGMFVD